MIEECIYIQFDGTITGDKFDQLNWDLYDKCVKLVDKCLDDAAMDATSVSDVLLFGGSSKVPMLQELVQVRLRVRGIQVSINREEEEPVVAYGAALVGAMLCTASIAEVQSISICDATTLSVSRVTFSPIIQLLALHDDYL